MKTWGGAISYKHQFHYINDKKKDEFDDIKPKDENLQAKKKKNWRKEKWIIKFWLDYWFD